MSNDSHDRAANAGFAIETNRNGTFALRKFGSPEPHGEFVTLEEAADAAEGRTPRAETPRGAPC